MEPYNILWINETQLVEANATQIRCFNREGELLGRLDQGAKLLACHPVNHKVRYLTCPEKEGGKHTFRDWDWQTGDIDDLRLGSMFTYCCAFDAQGSFVECGDWEDGGYWRGIAHTGEGITGSNDIPVLCSVAFSPDGSRLLLGGRWHYCAIWPFRKGVYNPERVFAVPAGVVNAVAWSASGTYVAALNILERLMVWDVSLDFPVADMPAIANFKLSQHKISFVRGAEHLIWISTGTCVQLLNWQRQIVVHTIPDCRGFALSPSGALAAYRREIDLAPVVVQLSALGNEEDHQTI
jgi:WD40 repeat protein